MKGQTNRSIADHALQRKLRAPMTDAERALWQRLRGRQVEGAKFRRQHPFLDYIVDFVCLERQLIMEVDGGQHDESKRDRMRDDRLSSSGFRVLRCWNHEVLQQTDDVVAAVRQALLALPPSPPQPSP